MAVYSPSFSRTEFADAPNCHPVSMTVETSAGPVRLSCVSDVAMLEPVWRRLEQISRSSYAQTFACAKAWSDHVLRPRGFEPVVIVGSHPNGATLFIWPFQSDAAMGQRVLRWLGQDHNNYNMGLFEPEFARRLTAADMKRLVAEAGRAAGAGALLLVGQPTIWDDATNPFSLLRAQPGANSGHAVRLAPDFEALYQSHFSGRSRSALKRKEKKLGEIGPVQYGWAQTDEERLRLLDIFFAQKTERFSELGQYDAFAEGGYRNFYRSLACLPASDPAHLHVGFIQVGEVIAATFCGTLHQDRFVVLFSSLAEGEELRKGSPGALLISHQIADMCARGVRLYDMGAGFGRHKSDWCDVEQKLFDCMLPIGAAGAFITGPAKVKGALKRIVKNDPRLWPLYEGLRRRIYGRAEDQV